MRLHLQLLAATICVGLLAACGSAAPPSAAPPQQSTIATATPYPQPPVPTIVDASGAVRGSGSATGSTAPKEVAYRVEAGDTLLAIASKFDATVETIVKRNNITNPADLKIGQDLVIPTTSTVLATATPTPTGTARPTATGTTTATATPTPRPSITPTASPTATPAASGGASITYAVQAGDTSFDIASRFGVSVEDLAKANNRTVASLASLQIGDKLTIPVAR